MTFRRNPPHMLASRRNLFRTSIVLCVLAFSTLGGAFAQNLRFAPVIYGVDAVNGLGAATIMKAPNAIATDVFGNLYIADTNADIVRKVDPSGTATIFAGGSYGNSGDGGLATAAGITAPTAIAADPAGNVYFTDSQNYSIRKVDKAGVISTYAGGHGNSSSGDGGAATSAQIAPGALTSDIHGNLFIIDLVCKCVRVVNPAGIISTVTATAGQLSDPEGLATDTAGNLFIADYGQSNVRKVDTLGVMTIFAGTTYGYSGDGGLAVSAQLRTPTGLATDAAGNLYIADFFSDVVRVVNSSGMISTVAGSTPSTTAFDDGLPADHVQMAKPRGVATDSNGNLFIVVPEMDRAYQVVLHPETFQQTIVGATSVNQRLALVNYGQTDVTITSVTFNGDFHFSPSYLPEGQQCGPNVYLPADVTGWCAIDVAFTPTAEGIRSYSLTVASDAGPVTQTLSSTGIGSALAMNTGQLFVVGGNHSITNGYRGEGGPATAAQIETLYGLVVDSSGNIFFSEFGNCQVRRIDGQTGILTTIAGAHPERCDQFTITGDGGPATEAIVPGPEDLALDAHNDLYIADGEDGLIRMIDTAGIIHTVAGLAPSLGSPLCGYTGDGGQATQAYLCNPQSLTFDKAGNLFFIEGNNEIVRKIDSAGILTTVAGNFALGAGFSGDGGPATSAQLNHPQGLAIDSAGDVFIADTYNDVIRKIDAATGHISTIAGQHGVQGLSGDGSVASKATMSWPMGLSIDAAGDLFFADRNNSVVRKIDTAGTITTVAGNRTIGQGYNGDRLLATATTLSFPINTFVAASGYLYIADTSNELIRELTPNGMLNFGTQKVGTTSLPLSVTLSNVGNTPLHFDSQFPTGISGDFAVAAGGNCNFAAALSVGASCTANLTFSPTAAGPRYGIFGFYDDGVASPQYVALSGTGTAQQPQTINFPPLADRLYGSPAVALAAVASSGLPVSYSLVLGNASITGSTLTIKDIGPIEVAANQAGDASWLPTPTVTQSFNVNPATLTVTADNKTSVAGQPLLPLTASIKGFVNGDQPGVVSGGPSLSTTASPGTIDTFPINISLGTLAASNYTFSLVPGTYAVTLAPRVPDGVVKLTTSGSLTRTGDFNYLTVTVANTGTATAQSVALTSIKLNSLAGTPATALLGNIPAGGSATVRISFAAIAGVSGATAIEQITGSYSGGTFGGTYRATLP